MQVGGDPELRRHVDGVDGRVGEERLAQPGQVLQVARGRRLRLRLRRGARARRGHRVAHVHEDCNEQGKEKEILVRRKGGGALVEHRNGVWLKNS